MNDATRRPGFGSTGRMLALTLEKELVSRPAGFILEAVLLSPAPLPGFTKPEAGCVPRTPWARTFSSSQALCGRVGMQTMLGAFHSLLSPLGSPIIKLNGEKTDKPGCLRKTRYTLQGLCASCCVSVTAIPRTGRSQGRDDPKDGTGLGGGAFELS